MTLRDLQCPACRAWFRTSNSTKRYCTSECQQRHKATVRSRHSRNGGNVSALRSRQVLTPQERWQEALPGILRRFRKDMRARYADEPADTAALIRDLTGEE